MNRIIFLASFLSILLSPAFADDLSKPAPGSTPDTPALRGVTQLAAPNTGHPLEYGNPRASSATPINDSLTKLKTEATEVTSTTPPPPPKHPVNLSTNLLSATAKLLEVAPLMRCRDDNLKFVEITLHNDSSEVALVHGDIAEAKVADRLRTAASARYIGTIAKPKLNNKGRVYTGLVLAGSWGLAAPIFYEYITPDQHRKRYLGTAVGVDGSRHEIEDQRFGLRVLMPGEETIGWLAFECPTSNDLTSLLIPVNYSKSALPSGSLYVPVAAANATGPAAESSTSLATPVKRQSAPLGTGPVLGAPSGVVPELAAPPAANPAMSTPASIKGAPVDTLSAPNAPTLSAPNASTPTTPTTQTNPATPGTEQPPALR